MTISLHQALIPSMLQILQAGKGWLAKAAASSLAEADILEARLIGDMLPFAYQMKSMAVHSMGAIEGVKAGVFSPDMSEPPTTLAGLDARLDVAISYLSAVGPDEVEALRGRPMRFEVGERGMAFTVEDFLLSFSQPNFYFHAATGYGVLRMLGVDLGKRDYLGPLRVLS